MAASSPNHYPIRAGPKERESSQLQKGGVLRGNNRFDQYICSMAALRGEHGTPHGVGQQSDGGNDPEYPEAIAAMSDCFIRKY